MYMHIWKIHLQPQVSGSVFLKGGFLRMKTDTIAAIATGMSDSGIGIIRISGDNAINVADQIYRAKNQNKKAV